ncbi:peptidoglycan-binding protein [Planococcus sp. SE5232]|uniref:peptidoglycan-binding protein n=1 Tax=unclassified Planococcus (in: firmicutes) TaxID=2662419 RepID=UPI003D6A32B7
MPNMKRITDLSKYEGILPYDSELFGVYQSLIGWKSKRIFDRMKSKNFPLITLSNMFENKTKVMLNADSYIEKGSLKVGEFAEANLIPHNSVIILKEIYQKLQSFGKVPQDADEWSHLINDAVLNDILNDPVRSHYSELASDKRQSINAAVKLPNESDEVFYRRKHHLMEEVRAELVTAIEKEIKIAGVIKELIANKHVSELNKIFYRNLDLNAQEEYNKLLTRTQNDFHDPYLTFDPTKDIDNVNVSPLGIVHLYRQFFFELDTFLGTPTSHVWLSPGSTVELIETSTRKTIIEKTTETFTETSNKTEDTLVSQEDLSESVKEENKNDLKLGFTTTVNQSWGTGSMTATGNLNMDKTQQFARETVHKKMRQQTQKLSTEIRQSFKSTFKIVTETTDTSSKRYVLNNSTDKLINYELRRKMRQVGVQVQDIGTFLCWQTFVDEPGNDLGLANLIHVSSPVELVVPTNPEEIPLPPDRPLFHKVYCLWNYDEPKAGFIGVGEFHLPPAPDGFDISIEPEHVHLPATQLSARGEDFTGVWSFGARFKPNGKIEVGVLAYGLPDGLDWDERVDFEVQIEFKCVPNNDTRNKIKELNKQRQQDAEKVATEETFRKASEVAFKDAKERINIASKIAKRNFEDLREEERILVYRKLISSLMSELNYKHVDGKRRHVLSELINSIFDIDKMLYFVAPDWWKPRTQQPSIFNVQTRINNLSIAWPDMNHRPANYMITDASAPAPMGSSLGWLLQLDGDNLRNTFLNAPWVKAVIPIRPGKEKAALKWLQSVNVEGADGLDAEYAAPEEELDAIRNKMGLADETAVTLKDAIDFLCMEVAEKHEESLKVKTFPQDPAINDDDKVNTTPTQKVFEHGFYALHGGFRAQVDGGNPNPDNSERNFQVFDQWIEVLPTDQVVPVEVEYDPKTGRGI